MTHRSTEFNALQIRGLPKSLSALSLPPARSPGTFPSPLPQDGWKEDRWWEGRRQENVRTDSLQSTNLKFNIVCKGRSYSQHNYMHCMSRYAKTCKSHHFKCKYIHGIFNYLCHLDMTLRITLVETTALGTIFLYLFTDLRCFLKRK